jgi:pimeloyl-ACP methyl ester carboxylesterase
MSSQPRFVSCITPRGLHRLAYYEWGDVRSDRVLICAHGLTRSGRDFDALARAFGNQYRVICPDYPGRGASDWLSDPAEYQIPVYVADTITLIARLDVEQVDWIGTSMGGLIGMALASLPKTPLRTLVLNDAGPLVEAVALARIAQYVGQGPSFADFQSAEHYVRAVCAPFGPHSDEEWRFLTEVVVRPDNRGGLRLHYDPAIAQAFNTAPPGKPIDLWPVYDAIRVPTLVIRGAESDLLSVETAKLMTQRGPRAQLVEIPGVGHAPTLMHPDQIGVVCGFLAKAIYRPAL